MERVLDRKIIINTCQIYWKDKTLYEVDFQISLNSQNIENSVFQSLSLAEKLGRNWYVQGPIETELNCWSFSGVCNEPIFVGLHWASFEIENEKHGIDFI
ncbi:hypothetical protein QMM61_06725 [Leptospira santarosai]|nr:hypothetical protein [Leptospira santarosai]MDI7196395.1 hypothetical protein [Leptospira santarosai]